MQAMADYAGQPLGFDRLWEVTGMITDLYSGPDWMDQTFLPWQDITEGVVFVGNS